MSSGSHRTAGHFSHPDLRLHPHDKGTALPGSTRAGFQVGDGACRAGALIAGFSNTGRKVAVAPKNTAITNMAKVSVATATDRQASSRRRRMA